MSASGNAMCTQLYSVVISFTLSLVLLRLSRPFVSVLYTDIFQFPSNNILERFFSIVSICVSLGVCVFCCTKSFIAVCIFILFCFWCCICCILLESADSETKYKHHCIQRENAGRSNSSTATAAALMCMRTYTHHIHTATYKHNTNEQTIYAYIYYMNIFSTLFWYTIFSSLCGNFSAFPSSSSSPVYTFIFMLLFLLAFVIVLIVVVYVYILYTLLKCTHCTSTAAHTHTRHYVAQLNRKNVYAFRNFVYYFKH